MVNSLSADQRATLKKQAADGDENAQALLKEVRSYESEKSKRYLARKRAERSQAKHDEELKSTFTPELFGGITKRSGGSGKKRGRPPQREDSEGKGGKKSKIVAASASNESKAVDDHTVVQLKQDSPTSASGGFSFNNDGFSAFNQATITHGLPETQAVAGFTDPSSASAMQVEGLLEAEKAEEAGVRLSLMKLELLQQDVALQRREVALRREQADLQLELLRFTGSGV